MLRTVYTPTSNLVSLTIPDIYVGSKLEITVSPQYSKKQKRILLEQSLAAGSKATYESSREVLHEFEQIDNYNIKSFVENMV